MQYLLEQVTELDLQAKTNALKAVPLSQSPVLTKKYTMTVLDQDGKQSNVSSLITSFLTPTVVEF
jgi:hypothetical protein